MSAGFPFSSSPPTGQRHLRCNDKMTEIQEAVCQRSFRYAWQVTLASKASEKAVRLSAMTIRRNWRPSLPRAPALDKREEGDAGAADRDGHRVVDGPGDAVDDVRAEQRRGPLDDVARGLAERLGRAECPELVAERDGGRVDDEVCERVELAAERLAGGRHVGEGIHLVS